MPSSLSSLGHTIATKCIMTHLGCYTNPLTHVQRSPSLWLGVRLAQCHDLLSYWCHQFIQNTHTHTHTHTHKHTHTHTQTHTHTHKHTHTHSQIHMHTSFLYLLRITSFIIECFSVFNLSHSSFTVVLCHPTHLLLPVSAVKRLWLSASIKHPHLSLLLHPHTHLSPPPSCLPSPCSLWTLQTFIIQLYLPSIGYTALLFLVYCHLPFFLSLIPFSCSPFFLWLPSLYPCLFHCNHDLSLSCFITICCFYEPSVELTAPVTHTCRHI